MNHIELFSGCGGLALGLEKSGFNLVMANELSPMAAETFSFNFFKENLSELSTKTLWIKSNYKKEEVKKRLKENPKMISESNGDIFSDIQEAEGVKGKLLIGSIKDLNHIIESDISILNQINDNNLDGGLDLVSGGPPCQSYSMAGLREYSNERNTLPWEFAKFVNFVKPKFVLLENVSGILRAFDENGVKTHAWHEVAKSFAKIKYIPICLHVNAKYVGVPQNRPRFILIGVRNDVMESLKLNLNMKEKSIIKNSLDFYYEYHTNGDVEFGDLKYFDVDKEKHLFEGTFLSPLLVSNSTMVSVEDAIGDLSMNDRKNKSEYVDKLNSTFSDMLTPKDSIRNFELRNNSAKVKKRFRIYQNMNSVSKKSYAEIKKIINGDVSDVSDEMVSEIKYLKFIDDDGRNISFSDKSDIKRYFIENGTKKHSQKALDKNRPAPAALSIPDDACHYSDLRSLTVREMARIQSFPDDFEFLSKVTTGGKMRSFEVPQYTQVGNAVPPLLGLALGNTIKNLMKKI